MINSQDLTEMYNKFVDANYTDVVLTPDNSTKLFTDAIFPAFERGEIQSQDDMEIIISRNIDSYTY